MSTFRTTFALAAAALFAAGLAATPAAAQQNQENQNADQSQQDGRPAYARPGAYNQSEQQAQQGQQNRQQAQQRQQGGQSAQGESEGEEATGGAVMRERQVTNVDISSATAPRIVVLFTGEQGGDGLEIIFMDQQSSEGEARTASGGQEIVFSPSNAVNGVVAHELEGGSSQGQARQASQRQNQAQGQDQQNDGPTRQLVVRAELDGKQLEISEAAKQDNMIVMTVRMSQQEEGESQQQGQRQNQQRQNRNANSSGGEQQGGTEAVILVYLGEQQSEASN